MNDKRYLSLCSTSEFKNMELSIEPSPRMLHWLVLCGDESNGAVYWGVFNAVEYYL